MYPPDEPIPNDHNEWKQCHTCGTIIPVYEAKKESRLEDFVETSDNPFDEGRVILVLITNLLNPGFRNKGKDYLID